uniref:Uncharacterized protein n=1 Tax=Anopheles coluzzii TaxID=1518534 RepID=A0A8W7Q0F7_ANOCL
MASATELVPESGSGPDLVPESTPESELASRSITSSERIGGGQPAAQQLRHHVHNLLVQLREAQHLLLHLRAAVLNDPLHLLVDQLHAAQGRILQAANLALHQQLEAYLRHEQGRPRPGRIPDRRQYVHLGQPRQRVDRVERFAERFVENVANPRTAAQLRRLDVARRALDRGAVGGRKLGNDLQQALALVRHVLAVRVQQRLELGRHHVDARLQIRQTVADVVHQQPVERFGQVRGAVARRQRRVLALQRFITPMMPSFTGMTRPHRMSIASVPASIRSSLVSTASVRRPSGSTSFAILSASLVAMSVLAAVTASMIEFGFSMYFSTRSLICASMSSGWSPTGTFVMPGRSTSVRLTTFVE